MMAADPILHWNEVALEAAFAPAAPSPVPFFRNLAVVYVAMYDAVNAIDRSHAPYFADVHASRGASMEAAAAQAAHDTLAALYPAQQATFDAALAEDLVGIPPAYGVEEERLSLFKVRAAQGISGLVFREGEPQIFHNAASDPRTKKDLVSLLHVDNGITVPLVITAHGRADLAIALEVTPPEANQVVVRLKAQGLRASLMNKAANVEGELRRFIAKYVAKELEKPYVRDATVINVGAAIEKAAAGLGPREESPMADELTDDLPAAMEAELEHTAQLFIDSSGDAE